MTLSAMAKDFSLVNPSVLIESGESRIEVLRAMKEQQDEGLFCPHCYQRLGRLYEVRYRNSESRRVHFYHPKYESVAGECKNHSSESEKHLAAKEYVRQQLLIQGLINVSLEVQMMGNDGLVWRRPDLLVTYPNGAIEAHEVQVSPISLEQLHQRTTDLKTNGCSQVVWYLHGKAYCDSNREWLANQNLRCFRLWFEESDAAKPRIQLAQWEPPTPTKPLRQQDDCKPNKTIKATPQLPKPTITLNAAHRTTYPKAHNLHKQFQGWTLYPLAFNAYGDEVNCRAVDGASTERFFQSVPVDRLERVR